MSSAPGCEKRASSAVMTTIPAAFAHPSVVSLNAIADTGFGKPSPTQLTALPVVVPATRMLNGTRRRLGL
jgi:hypothetical protein